MPPKVIRLELNSDADTSDEENARFTHRMFEKIPEEVQIVAKRRMKKEKRAQEERESHPRLQLSKVLSR